MESPEATCSQLMARTIFYVDRHDIEAFVGLFDAKGILKARDLHHTGHEAIRSFMHGRDPARITRHVLGTPCIIVDGEQARGIAYFTLYEGRDGAALPPVALPVSVGEFHQEYRIGPSGWRVTSHQSVRVFSGHAEG